MRALIASSDLSIVSLATGAAARKSAELQVAMSPAALAEAIQSKAFELVIFDLGMPSLDIAAAMKKLREQAPSMATKTLAFGPHVQEAVLAAARSAGCDRVLSRGQFHSQIDAILGGGESHA
jgi:DNA-binding NarL/FixJ family response regulator